VRIIKYSYDFTRVGSPDAAKGKVCARERERERASERAREKESE
jgi:hypothetical protein